MRMGDYERASNVLSYATTTLDTIQIQNELMGLYRSLAISYTSLGNKTAADSIWLRFYKLKHDKFGSKGANALFSIIHTQEKELHQLQLQRIATRNQNILILVTVAGCALLIIISLLVWLYRKEKRRSQLIHDLYRRTLAAVPGDGNIQSLIEDSSDTTGGGNTDSPRLPPGPENHKQLAEIYEAVNKTLETSTKIYEPGFSINALSEIMGLQTYIVSQAINVIGNRNFSTLLAEWRISEACRRITDESYSRYTLAAIGQSVGFQSRTNFSSVFKKITGLSPTEFKKEHSRPK